MDEDAKKTCSVNTKQTLETNKRVLSESSFKTYEKQVVILPKIGKLNSYECHMNDFRRKIALNKDNKLRIIR